MKKIQFEIMEILLREKKVKKQRLHQSVSSNIVEIERYIYELNEYLESNHLGTILIKNDSYSLQLTNISSIYIISRMLSKTENEKENRVFLIISILLENQNYTTIQELSDKMFLSTRQISYELIKVRKTLTEYNLTLKSIPHYGLKIEGSELNKRICLSNVYNHCFEEDDKVLSQERIKKIREILHKTLQQNKYLITDYSFENLVIHLYIALLRVEADFKMNEIEPYFESDKKIEAIAKKIIIEIEKEFSIHLSENEYKYVVIHLQSKQNIRDEYYNKIPFEIYEMVNEFVKGIDEAYNTDLKLDFKLCMTLSLHFLPFISRIKYGFNLRNPLLEKIKTEFIYEYELAEYGCKILEKKLDVSISEDEISYIALDIKLSLDKRFNDDKANILLVCSTGRGTAELLKSELLNLFGSYIENMDISSYFRAERLNLDEYDYIFSTVPVFFKTRATVVQISMFMNECEIDKINSLLNSRYTLRKNNNYFPEELFMGNCDFNDKEDALKKMVEKISEVKKIPSNFYDLVIERESLAVTSFGNNVAMPHPAKLVTDDTFVCVAISNKPIKWDKDKEVQLIVLISVENKKNKNLKFFYNSLSKIVKNKENINRIISNPSYEVLTEIIFSETE